MMGFRPRTFRAPWLSAALLALACAGCAGPSATETAEPPKAATPSTADRKIEAANEPPAPASATTHSGAEQERAGTGKGHQELRGRRIQGVGEAASDRARSRIGCETRPSARTQVSCLHQLRDGPGKEMSKRIQQGVGRGFEIRTRTRRSRASDLESGTSQSQGRTRGQGGTRRQVEIEMSSHGPLDFRSHRSALHGPPPAAAMYRKTKQYSAANSPRLTIGQKFAGA